MDLASKLIGWYKKNKRDLPWRNTTDPYKIWLSEIILQQTRVEQGLSYYLKFSSKYPDITSFAEAKEEELLKLWQGLGYYSRARNMHFTAKEIVAKHNGKFPLTYSELLKLKGIGPYSAAAIASFAYGEKVPVIDGNVIRVISRVFGISDPVDSPKTLKTIKAQVTRLISEQKPSDFNQAIMEFGALNCKPKNPECDSCIFKKECIALAGDIVDKIPFKQKKTISRKRYLFYFVVSTGSNPELIIFKHRIEKDIWQNLYDFPMIETEKSIVPDEKFIHNGFRELFGNYDYSLISVSEKYSHKLTHQEIEAVFIQLSINSKPFKQRDSMVYLTKKTIRNYAIPRLIEKFLSRHPL